MTAIAATTARPLRAAIAWATKDSIFCEIPCRDGPSFIVREHKTAAGLARVLNILIENAEVETRTITRDHPKITKPAPSIYSDEQRARARALLKNIKIT